MKVLILGVNGFIGSNLTRAILERTSWEVYGMDLASDRIEPFLGNGRFRFLEGDLAINREWIEYHVKKCDVCLPLVAIATPAAYTRDPLAVFELDFEQNLRVIRQCARYGTRVIFPSTSEVYGMCPDEAFNEETSPLVYGPIRKQRWIYACSKQLLDRVIWAMGRDRGLRFTLIRPFNWIGPGLDSIDSPKEGSSRVVTQFLGHMLRGEPIKLVDGGRQRRSFTYIDDGIDCLMRILGDGGEKTNGRIFNIGNPKNDASVRDLAKLMISILGGFPGYEEKARAVRLFDVTSEEYYGKDHEDMVRRVPDITAVREALGWEPRYSLEDALRLTIAAYVGAGKAEEESLGRAGEAGEAGGA